MSARRFGPDGVGPLELWGEESSKLCREFMELAREHNFKHAYEFAPMFGDRALRAYGLGGAPDTKSGETLPVFLCEDDVIRVSDRIQPDTTPYGFSTGNALSNLDIHIGLGTPAPGYFSIRGEVRITGYEDGNQGYIRNQKVYEAQANPWMRDWFFPDRGKPVETWVNTGIDFHEVPLKDVIDVHTAALVFEDSGAAPPPSISNKLLFEAIYGDLDAEVIPPDWGIGLSGYWIVTSPEA